MGFLFSALVFLVRFSCLRFDRRRRCCCCLPVDNVTRSGVVFRFRCNA